MENAENVNSSSGQLPDALKRWILLTEDHLFLVFENGNEWTEQEIQAAKKCLRLRKQYAFKEVGEIPPRKDMKKKRLTFTLNEKAKGIIPTGLTVKEVAERERFCKKMDDIVSGKNPTPQTRRDNGRL